MSQIASSSAWMAGDEAVERARAIVVYALVVGAVVRQRQPETPAPKATPPDPAPTAPTFSPFPCMAIAETSNVPAMGPTYFTVYGMVRDIIEDYGTPEEQAAVFAGTATLEQQTDIASRFAADQGFGGWGVLTRQKCHLG